MPFHILEGRGGGAEVQAWLLAKELAKSGFSVYYIAQSIYKKTREEQIDGVVVKWVNYRKKVRWLGVCSYYRNIKRVNPDLLVVRGSSFLLGAVGFYKKRHGKKLIWMCSDNFSAHKWAAIKNAIKICLSQKNLLASLNMLMDSVITDIAHQYGIKCIDLAFNQNEFQKKRLKIDFGLNSYRIISGHRIPEDFSSPLNRLSRDIVLWVGNLGQRKRPEMFIELARISKNESLRFVMIGGREEESYLKNLFKDLPKNFIWLGKQGFEETEKWFDSASFFVCTSKFLGEGFPNTFVQSWVRGIPVLSIDVDPDGIIQANKLGFVCKSIKEIKEKIIFLRKNKEKYVAISSRARGYAIRNHSLNKMSEIFIKSIGNIL